MGILDYWDCKETRTDKKGREYIYNLTTRRVTRSGKDTHADTLGWADNSKQALDIANKDKG